MRENKTWQQELNDKRLASGGWYGCITPDGWKDIVLKADKMLSHMDPEYKINQVKEKFGTLRYYFETVHSFGSVQYEIMHAIEVWAEQRSANTCEQCGKFGELRDDRYWIVTLCDDCNESFLAERARLLEDIDEMRRLSDEIGERE